MDSEFIKERFARSIAVKQRTLEQCLDAIAACGETLVEALRRGHKLLLCGNGGSAADAQHLAAELVVKLRQPRRPLPAIALTTDTSILTATGNDFSFDQIFARQVEALGRPGDVLIGISTSGNSENVQQAVETAHGRNMRTIGLLGRDGGRLAAAVQQAVIVPDDDTQRIQESHLLIGHIWMEWIDAVLGEP